LNKPGISYILNNASVIIEINLDGAVVALVFVLQEMAKTIKRVNINVYNKK